MPKPGQKGGTMKKLLMAIPLVFLLCFAFSCQQGEQIAGEPAVDVQPDIQAIKDIVQEWEDGFNAGEIDTGRGMSHFAEDAIAIRPNEPALVGKEAIRSGRKQWVEELTLQEDYVVENVHVSGHLAVVYATWSNIAIPKAGGEPTKGKGNWIIIFKKQSNGALNCIYSIYIDESLVRPTQAE